MQRQTLVWVTGGLVLAVACSPGCKSRTLDPGGPGTGTLPVGSGGIGMGSGGDGTGGMGMGGARGTPRPLTLGEQCTSAADCASGFCTDGVCCNVACEEPCRHCDVPGIAGSCVNRIDGDPPRTPDGCGIEAASTCGRDGLCDGLGACRVRPVGTPCGFQGSCNGDAIVGREICDGHRACKVGPTIICVPFRCDKATAVCLTTCTTDAECGGTPCMNGSCFQPPREPCSRDQDCASNHCAQGVCCNTACDGICMACNLTGRQGSCTPRPSGTDCGQPTCTDGMVTGLKRCDTAGRCDAWAPELCAPFTCDPARQLCRTGCAGDSDCAATYTCVAGSCGRRESHTCDRADQCDSGFCSRGICCDAACDDPCHTCSLPGSIGVCQLNPVGCGMASDGGLP